MRKVQWRKQVFAGIFSLMAAFVLALTMDHLSIVSHAQSEGRALVDAKIRLDASKDSEEVGGVLQNGSVSINGQVMGTDGNVWYQVFVNADTLGYIRSDLVQITDGSTPSSLGGNTATTATVIPTTMTNGAAADVTEVNPVSATVSGGQQVRVRSDASTANSNNIVTNVQSGMALTVTGQTDGTDGKVWYQVHFTVNGSEVTGFIRSDYVTLSEELTPVVNDPEPEQPQPGETPAEPEQPVEPVQVDKDYDTVFQDNIWQLIDRTGEQEKRYDLVQVMNASNAFVQAEKTIKTQKIIMIVLVIVIIILAMVATLLFFKMKDISDDEYFAEVEKEAIRRRNPDKPQNTGARTGRPQGQGQGAARQGGTRTQQAGAQGVRRPQGSGSTRPVQGRPAQGTGRSAQSAQGTARPAQSGQGNRSAQGEGRPVQNSQGSRPAQGEGRPAQSAQGSRPEGRPAQNNQGSRPEGRPAQESQGGQRQEQPRQQNPDNAHKQGWKSKNFMADEENDEFEFEYLNWDGEEKN